MKQYSILSILITILWSCNPPIQKEVPNDKPEDIAPFELSESINEDVTSLAQHPKIKEANSKGLHFQHGEAQRFRIVLTAKQLADANKALAPHLARLGYEI